MPVDRESSSSSPRVGHQKSPQIPYLPHLTSLHALAQPFHHPLRLTTNNASFQWSFLKQPFQRRFAFGTHLCSPACTSFPTPAQKPQASQVPAQQAAPSQGPGLFGQMASTAAGVAVGSTIGHGLSSMLFGGGGSSTPAPEAPVQQQSFEERKMGGSCEIQAKDFTRCLDATQGSSSDCSYYLEQLKACQAAASHY